MMARILVVDPNEAFATMLRVMLEVDGGYEVEVVDSGTGALALLAQSEFDLTILDMDLAPEDLAYHQVAEQIRQIRPAMRLMLIPLMGEELPEEARRLGIQGTLSKPFFVDDLLPNIQGVLSKQVLPSRVTPSAPSSAKQAAPRAAKQFAPKAQSVLAELARETHADAVLLLSAAQDGGVLLYVSTLRASTVEALARQTWAVIQAVQVTAQLLDQREAIYEHNMFESATARLYIMTLPGDLLLVVAGPVSIPLGTVRHNLRRASRELGELTLT